jgi:glycosyltransferase involved in cell wall biosynthesis
MRTKARGLRERFYWDILTPELTKCIREHQRAADLTALQVNTTPAKMSAKARVVAEVQRALRDAIYVYRYTRQFGMRSATQLTRDVVRRRVRTKARPRVSPRGRLVMLAHYLDLSGAPLVLVDTAIDARAEWPEVPLALYAYLPVHSAHLLRMRRAGVPTQLLSSRDDPPPLESTDVLFMNTSMQSYPVRNHVYSRLEAGDLRAAVWYIHEDDPRRWFREDERRRIRDLLRQRRLKVLIAGQQVLGRYREFFESESGVVLQPYNITIPEGLIGARDASDFSRTLRFVLPGTMGDGRKGQLSVLYAFAAFVRLHMESDATTYREFELVFLGVEDDYLSEQLRHHEGSLKGRLRHYPKLPRDEALKIVAACNVTLCYSLYECLPIFVFEGMLAGHPILRNASSGVEEQLENGRNGYLLERDDFWQMVCTIERVLNRSTTSDQTLAGMSARSVEIAREQQAPSRLVGIREELEALSRHPTAVG